MNGPTWSDPEPTPPTLTPYGDWWSTLVTLTPPQWLGHREPDALTLESDEEGRLRCTVAPMRAGLEPELPEDAIFGARRRVPFPLRPESVVREREPEPGWQHFQDPGKVIVGIVDDGIAFANERFRRAENGVPKTRLDYLWLQGARAEGMTDLPFGRELDRKAINDLIKAHTVPGGVDEASVYREAGLIDMSAPEFQSASLAATHGTAVLDVAAGYAPDDPAGAQVTIIGIGLPMPIIQDTSGAFLDRFVMLGVDRILRRVEWLEAKLGKKQPYPVLINVSFALTAGPKDGSMPIDRYLRRCRQRRRLAFTLPAGNDRLSRVRARLAAGRRLTWRVLPDDRTASFLEIWMPLRAEGPRAPQMGLMLAAPGGAPTAPGTPPPFGQHVDLRAEGTPIARAYYDWHPDPARTGWGREQIVVALLPTVADEPGQPYGPPGDWQVALRGEGMADLFIQRDDTLFGGSSRGRQSYFVDAAYHDYDDYGGRIESDNGESAITRNGTINAFALDGAALGGDTFVVGATYGSDGRPTYYSGLGQNGIVPEIPSPNALAVADETRLREGVLAAGTYSGSTIRISGTSVAAPQICRREVEGLLI